MKNSLIILLDGAMNLDSGSQLAKDFFHWNYQELFFRFCQNCLLTLLL